MLDLLNLIIEPLQFEFMRNALIIIIFLGILQILGLVLHHRVFLEEPESHPGPTKHQVPVSQPLFPSCLLSVVPRLVEMLDDSAVDADGIAGNLLQHSRPL